MRISRRRPQSVIEVFTAAFAGGYPKWQWVCECNGVPNLDYSQPSAMHAACAHLKRGHYR